MTTLPPLDAERLNALPVSAEGRVAIAVLLEDQRLLRDHGLLPNLDCIVAYPRDKDPAVVPIDVYSFHADSATVQADTYLCTYFGPSSEGLRNEEAQLRVDIPETRAELLNLGMHFIPLSELYVPTAAGPADDGSVSPCFSGLWPLRGL